MGRLNKSEMERLRISTAREVVEGKARVMDAARKAGVTPRTASVWVSKYRRKGEIALLARPHTGRPRRLTARQDKELEKWLLKGAVACGFSSELWTCRRISQLIRDRFKVSYHPDHVGRILGRLGWTPQKPEKRAKERDEAAITAWVRKDWSRIQKKPAARKRSSPSRTRRH